VTVHPGHGDYDGNLGNDPRFVHWHTDWKKFGKNRYNAFFVSPSSQPWDGTPKYEGNTKHVLYEFKMSYANKIHFYSRGQIWAFCPVDSCPALN
jgi:hypothetical protein